ncbi:MAG TPA: FYDLN acid domain-containing protein [Thermoanaerobaculia bacterium]|nr:FYDLN acid domain-containing protein [Thermoanaerobaculia bacterium]
MTELKLGNKYECFNCGAKFYDLGKSSPVCPKCGADQGDAEERENPLVSQAVRRRRRAELLPDDDSAAADDDVETIAPGDIDEEDLELDDEEVEVEDDDEE